jgi:hypothetical protein
MNDYRQDVPRCPHDDAAASLTENWDGTERKLPAMNVFTIGLDDDTDDTRYALERTAGERFDVGQRVYETRGIPMLWTWTKRHARAMEPIRATVR